MQHRSAVGRTAGSLHRNHPDMAGGGRKQGLRGGVEPKSDLRRRRRQRRDHRGDERRRLGLRRRRRLVHRRPAGRQRPAGRDPDQRRSRNPDGQTHGQRREERGDRFAGGRTRTARRTERQPERRRHGQLLHRPDRRRLQIRRIGQGQRRRRRSQRLHRQLRTRHRGRRLRRTALGIAPRRRQDHVARNHRRRADLPGRLRDLLDGAFGGQRRDRREGHQRQHRLELAHLGLQRRNHGARPHRLGRQSRRHDHGPQPRSAEQHPDGRGQPRHVLRVGPQGPLHAFAIALPRGYRRQQRPGLQRTEHRDRRRNGNMGLQRAGRRARHAAGQHSQFDPEPDDLPAIAVQRPRRLVLHGNRPEGHASGAVGSR